MSGGFWDYKDSALMCDIFGYSAEEDNVPNVFEDKEISELVYDVFQLLHDFDWYQEGDTCEETWLEKKHAFKKKWFENREQRTLEIIDKSIAELKEELYKTFKDDYK